MRVLVTGDRNWECEPTARSVICRIISQYGKDFVIVHGDCRGVDRSFESAARFLDIATDPHPADWKTHGLAAGMIRNREMVKKGAALCIALHRDIKNSKGTKDCIQAAMKAGIPTYLVACELGTPFAISHDPTTAYAQFGLFDSAENGPIE